MKKQRRSHRPAAVLILALCGCSSMPSEVAGTTGPSNKDAPIACSLSPDELASRRDQLLPGLIREAEKVTEIENGLRLTFAHSVDALRKIVGVVEQEQRCCTFLRFQITTEPDHGPIVFEVTGPVGTLELLKGL
jgi:hypothetical protein